MKHINVYEFKCDLCGSAMTVVHCKLKCLVCGFIRDCSDP